MVVIFGGKPGGGEDRNDLKGRSPQDLMEVEAEVGIDQQEEAHQHSCAEGDAVKPANFGRFANSRPIAPAGPDHRNETGTAKHHEEDKGPLERRILKCADAV